MKKIHIPSPPYGGGGEDDAIHRRRFRTHDRDHHHRAAHAFAKQIDRRAGMPLLDQFDDGDEVVGQGRFARPFAGMRGLAEPALVIGVKGDPLACQEFADFGEGMAVVVEAMQGDDHRLRFIIGPPGPQRQFGQIGSHDGLNGNRGSGQYFHIGMTYDPGFGHGGSRGVNGRGAGNA